MGFDGGATDRIDDRVHLETFAESVERGNAMQTSVHRRRR